MINSPPVFLTLFTFCIKYPVCSDRTSHRRTFCVSPADFTARFRQTIKKPFFSPLPETKKGQIPRYHSIWRQLSNKRYRPLNPCNGRIPTIPTLFQNSDSRASSPAFRTCLAPTGSSLLLSAGYSSLSQSFSYATAIYYRQRICCCQPLNLKSSYCKNPCKRSMPI